MKEKISRKQQRRKGKKAIIAQWRATKVQHADLYFDTNKKPVLAHD